MLYKVSWLNRDVWNDSVRTSTDPLTSETGENVLKTQPLRTSGDGPMSKQQVKKKSFRKKNENWVRKGRVCNIWIKTTSFLTTPAEQRGDCSPGSTQLRPRWVGVGGGDSLPLPSPHLWDNVLPWALCAVSTEVAFAKAYEVLVPYQKRQAKETSCCTPTLNPQPGAQHTEPSVTHSKACPSPYPPAPEMSLRDLLRG